MAWGVMSALHGVKPTDAAALQGKYARWRAPLDYMSLVRLDVDLGILDLDNGTCLAATDLYGPITCPSGYFKKPLEQVESACQTSGVLAYGNWTNCYEVRATYQLICLSCFLSYQIACTAHASPSRLLARASAPNARRGR